MPRSHCLRCRCPQCLAPQKLHSKLLPDKTSHECASIMFVSLRVMDLYCLQTSTTDQLLALSNSFYHLCYPFSYDRLQKPTLCFWCKVENTMDCSLTFNIPTINPEILTFLWWHTVKHLGSEALKSFTWGLHPHLCPSACGLGLQGRTGERPHYCPLLLAPSPWHSHVSLPDVRLGVMLPGLPKNCYSLHSHWFLQNCLWGWTWFLLPQASWNFTVSLCQCWNCHLENSRCLWGSLNKPLFSCSLAIERWWVVADRFIGYSPASLYYVPFQVA